MITKHYTDDPDVVELIDDIERCEISMSKVIWIGGIISLTFYVSFKIYFCLILKAWHRELTQEQSLTTENN